MRTLELLDRKPGERCCDLQARPSTTFADAAAIASDFELLAHPVRLQLLDVLARNAGRVCVCDLEASVPVKQPTVSHHLKLLREAGIVDSEKVGVWAYYHLNRDRLSEMRSRLAARLNTLT
jgi:ArsR family transcriptional regulator